MAENARASTVTKSDITTKISQPAQEVNLTNQIKNLCDLSADQAAKIDPIVNDFVAKRNEAYRKYRHDPSTLAKMVKDNRWEYEKALVSVLNPSQMGLVKVFDQRNPDLMKFNSRTLIDVSYFKSDESVASTTPVTPVVPVASEQKSVPVAAPVVADKPKEQPVSETKTSSNTAQPAQEVDLTHQMKELCDLSTEQIAKVNPVVANFVAKREETYKKYRHNPGELTRMVKQNKWEYEVALAGILTPSQMGLLKVFDQRNPELMTFNSAQVNDVSYLADNR